MMPFSWLYFRVSVKGGSLGVRDLIHLIPALIYLVDYFPFFILSSSEKLVVLQGLDRYGLKGAYGEGWFMPKGWHNILRYFIICVYWIAQWRLLRKHPLLPLVQSRWLNSFLYSQLLIFLPAIVILVSGRSDVYNLAANFFGLIAALIQGYMLLMYPEILYGFNKGSSQAKENNVAEMGGKTIIDPDQHKTGKQVDTQLVDRISKGLDHLMGDQKLYLLPELRLFHVSEKLGVPVYKLSAFFNDVEKKNFFEYVNTKRIEFFITKIHSGEARLKTLEALSRESGFTNRATFIRAFRKETGKTPTAYIRGLTGMSHFEE
jgi:AraC-like DNA-binding protein